MYFTYIYNFTNIISKNQLTTSKSNKLFYFWRILFHLTKIKNTFNWYTIKLSTNNKHK